MIAGRSHEYLLVLEPADDRPARAGVRLYLKRDDLISREIPGNKWRKLALNLEAAPRGTGLTLDWVYVAKMMCGIYACAERGTFAPGTTVVAVVTG
jgi:1-aminocyclopropane-1-carboxylate deaminase/D-cysteine desulfhydrase-like pyridoxal-dependent ACC family enzyme